MKKASGSTGPDTFDVLTMFEAVRSDLKLRVAVQVEPWHNAESAQCFRVTLRCLPIAQPGTIWVRWRPLDLVEQWTPTATRDFAHHLWHRLFALYSYDFPSDWPTDPVVTQLPLAGG